MCEAYKEVKNLECVNLCCCWWWRCSIDESSSPSSTSLCQYNILTWNGLYKIVCPHFDRIQSDCIDGWMNRSKQGTLRDAYFLFLFFFHIFFSLVCCCCIHYSSYSYGQISFITQFILSVCVCLCVHYTLFYEIGFFFLVLVRQIQHLLFSLQHVAQLLFSNTEKQLCLSVCVW